MIPDIKELNFPKKDGKQYATLTHATATLSDMEDKTITTQMKIDGDIIPDFSYDWAVEFQGEKYIMPLRIPQGSKGNESLMSEIELTFQHWAIYQLKRWPFVTIQQLAAGTYIADEEEATVQLNLGDFCKLLGQVMEYYFGDAITVDFNDDPATGWKYDKTPTVITISHTKIWNVLTEALYDKYGVRWEIKAREGNDNTTEGGERYVVRIGYPTKEVSHILEYGFEGGLLKVERQVQSDEIRNVLKGRGGDKNIPFRYFKKADTNNQNFAPDPDWVVELENAYFTNLMGATFRSYIQGWKAAHINQEDADGNKLYQGYTPVGESKAYSPWAYRKGYTDSKFQPVEFVADEIVLNPAEGDKQVEILPGYKPYVDKDSSLAKYGPLPDTLDNEDEIYPTIQGTGLDIAVDVEQIESDDVKESAETEAKIWDVEGGKGVKAIAPGTGTIEVRCGDFSVPAGETGSIERLGTTSKGIRYNKPGLIAPYRIEKAGTNYEITGDTIEVRSKLSGETVSSINIPAGDYECKITYTVRNKLNPSTLGALEGRDIKITITCEGLKLVTKQLSEKWANTFDIWVKNIWGSEQGATESDTEYSERVWAPVLGDREGNTGKVVFTTGALVHEDYEFTIVDFPVPDNSKSWQDADGVTHTSHWRITLAKSDAELEATGLYVPSTKKQGKAGDTFAFIGTELTHYPYVTNAEILVDDNKKDRLGEKKEIKPTFVVTTDRIRFSQENIADASDKKRIAKEAGGLIMLESGGAMANEKAGITSLLRLMKPGDTIRLADKRFIQPLDNKAYETLFLQSITYTFREPSNEDAALNPDVEITLGNEYAKSANPVSMLQGDISVLQRQIGAVSNVEQIVRAIGDKLYLRKDGISDTSLSPTQFFSLLTSGDFRSGMLGGAGWGFFKDANGNWVLETDCLNVRQQMQVSTIVNNQVEGRGGMIVESAASLEFTKVYDTEAGYECHFDAKLGSLGNLFHAGDVAYCQRFDPQNNTIKSYKRRVMSVGDDKIVITKGYAAVTMADGTTDTGVNGSGVPEEGDVIVQYGSYTDAERRYVIVRDMVGGSYERFIEGLDSVNATGTEYYFAGRQSGVYNGRPRFFIGDADSYIEYCNGKLAVKGQINSKSTVVDENGAESDLDNYIQSKNPRKESGSGNLLLNTAFEDGYAHWVEREHTSIDTEITLGGTPSFKISRSGATSDEFIGLLQRAVEENNPIMAIAGQRHVTASVWVYCGTAASLQTLQSEGAKLELSFVNSEGVNIATSYTSVSIVPTKVGEWQRFSVTAQIDSSWEDVYAPNLFIYAVRNGELWLARPQLEWGEVLTPWAPNPQDASAYISDKILRAKSEEGTIEGGLILASLMKLGYTAINGEYRVMSGLSGIAENADDIALWTGGEMIDAAKHPEVDGKALAVIRHNGTAYFCGNTVRMYDDHMEIGDSAGVGAKVVVDRTGLYLKDANGSNRLAVKNEVIPLDLASASSVVTMAGSDTTGQVTIYRYKQPTLSLLGGGTLQSRPAEFYVCTSVKSDRAFNTALTEGSLVTGQVQMQFNFNPKDSANGDLLVLNVQGKVSVIKVDSDGTETVASSQWMHFEMKTYGLTYRFTAKATLNATIPSDGNYIVRTEIVPYTVPDGATVKGTTNVSFTAQSGKAVLGVDGQTVIGLNGLMTIWDNARFVVASDSTSGFVGMLAGQNGFRVTSGGAFEKTLPEYNGQWKACNLPDKT